MDSQEIEKTLHENIFKSFRQKKEIFFMTLLSNLIYVLKNI